MAILNNKESAKINKILGTNIALKYNHWSRYNKNQLEQIGEGFERVLLSDNPKDILFNLCKNTWFFNIFIPELYALEKVPQHKQNSKNALHHSLIVASNVVPNKTLRWAALLHDIGKARFKIWADGTMYFRNHEYNGSKDARGILKRMSIGNQADICHLIRYHSHPLDYQRQPNWKMSTIKNFCYKHNELAIPLIDLAIADKISSSSQADYLEELYMLRKYVEEIQYPYDTKTV